MIMEHLIIMIIWHHDFMWHHYDYLTSSWFCEITMINWLCNALWSLIMWHHCEYVTWLWHLDDFPIASGLCNMLSICLCDSDISWLRGILIKWHNHESKMSQENVCHHQDYVTSSWLYIIMTIIMIVEWHHDCMTASSLCDIMNHDYVKLLWCH